MKIDAKTIETLVEIITREVLLALENQDLQDTSTEDAGSKKNATDGVIEKINNKNSDHIPGEGRDHPTIPSDINPEDEALARMIDHTLLKPEATAVMIAQLCYEARQYHFASVCVNPTHVKFCAKLLHDTDVKVCTVIGFPLGATSTAVKAYETKNAIKDGAAEVDMVINIGALKAGDKRLVARDIRAIVTVGHDAGALVKVIIETALLTDEEKITACLLAKEAGADFVKTSTGFSGGGATVDDVTLMKRTVGATVGVKASGGIRTREDAEQMIAAGATRLGTSAGIKIIQADDPEPKPEPKSGNNQY